MPVAGLKREAEHAAESRTVGLLGRVGLVAKGISYALVALLAIQVAVRGRGKPEGREEALAAIADERVGRGVLVVLAVGFAGYAIWRFADGLFDRHDEGRGAVGLGKRAGYVGLALFYAGLCALTVALLSGRESAGGSGEEEKATATVLEWPFGTWLVALVGGAFIAAAAANAGRALT